MPFSIIKNLKDIFFSTSRYVKANLMMVGIVWIIVVVCCSFLSLRYCFGMCRSKPGTKKKRKKKRNREESEEDDRLSENDGQLATPDDEWMAVGSGGAQGGALRIHSLNRCVRTSDGRVGRVVAGEPMDGLTSVRDVVKVLGNKPRSKSFYRTVSNSVSRLASRSIELQERNRSRSQSKSPVPEASKQGTSNPLPGTRENKANSLSGISEVPKVEVPVAVEDGDNTNVEEDKSVETPPTSSSSSSPAEPVTVVNHEAIKIQTRSSLLSSHYKDPKHDSTSTSTSSLISSPLTTGGGIERGRSPTRGHSPTRSASPVRIPGSGNNFARAGNVAYHEQVYDPRKTKRKTSFATSLESSQPSSSHGGGVRGTSPTSRQSRSPSPSRAFGGGPFGIRNKSINNGHNKNHHKNNNHDDDSDSDKSDYSSDSDSDVRDGNGIRLKHVKKKKEDFVTAELNRNSTMNKEAVERDSIENQTNAEDMLYRSTTSPKSAPPPLPSNSFSTAPYGDANTTTSFSTPMNQSDLLDLPSSKPRRKKSFV
mmetsp:Transcript_6183/g.7997  ORF Transcript_6183/g.7997 Transcript_6183/m.7997 type:complete len:536 (+) Transcript_6183:91-1698(+)